MKHLLLLLTLFIGGLTYSQGTGDLAIYSNTGDKFYVVLNGIRQNDKPETNVKVVGLTDNYYSCKILSANNNFTLEKNVIVKHDTLITYSIIKKKDDYKLRFYSESSLGTATSIPDQSVVTYHATDNPVTTVSTEGTPPQNTTNVNTNNTVTSTTTTTTIATTENVGTNTNLKNGNNTETVNLNVSITENGMGANVNMNVTGTGLEGENMNTNTNVTENGNTSVSTSTTTGGNGTTTYYEETTVTTTTTSSSNNGEAFTSTNNNNNVTGTQTQQLNNNNCYTSEDEVDAMVKQVKNEAFADDQQRVANIAAKNKCMNTAQIKRVAEAFSFSENQLNFLKAAYNNCSDKGNYYQLLEVLTFSSDKEELEKFINSK